MLDKNEFQEFLDWSKVLLNSHQVVDLYSKYYATFPGVRLTNQINNHTNLIIETITSFHLPLFSFYITDYILIKHFPRRTRLIDKDSENDQIIWFLSSVSRSYLCLVWCLCLEFKIFRLKVVFHRFVLICTGHAKLDHFLTNKEQDNKIQAPIRSE